MDTVKLTKLASSVRTGGKGTVRRKKKAGRKSTSGANKSTTTHAHADDDDDDDDDDEVHSKLKSKRIRMETIPDVEEVLMFIDRKKIFLEFLNPKVERCPGAKMWLVTGPRTTRFQDPLPSKKRETANSVIRATAGGEIRSYQPGDDKDEAFTKEYEEYYRQYFETEGYGITIVPRVRFPGQIYPIALSDKEDEVYKAVLRCTKFAIAKNNREKVDSPLELVKVKQATYTYSLGFMFYIRFEGRDSFGKRVSYRTKVFQKTHAGKPKTRSVIVFEEESDDEKQQSDAENQFDGTHAG